MVFLVRLDQTSCRDFHLITINRAELNMINPSLKIQQTSLGFGVVFDDLPGAPRESALKTTPVEQAFDLPKRLLQFPMAQPF